MESINALRTYCDSLEGATIDDNHVSAEYVAKRTAINVRRYANAIEQELADRYMELPQDADGVPIHVGDVVEFGENRNQGIVKALNEHMVIAMHVDDGCMNYAKYGLLWSADACRHAKPRTLEDVLREFAQGVQGQNADFADAAVKRYADEIRELMEVDE